MSEVLLTIGGKPVHGRRAPCGPHLLPDEREAPGKLHPQGHNGLPLEPRLASRSTTSIAPGRHSRGNRIGKCGH
jgi:hypothetical protein